MVAGINHFNDPKTLFGRLRSACADEWAEYCNHEFVQRIGDATLPEQSFRYYLEQDYLFLIQFSRAWALAVYKADTLAEMRAAVSSLNAHINHEMYLHVKYCAGWGITEQEMELKNEARANIAYTRYVLERGFAGDVLDLHVALAPCIIGYAVIGKNLVNDPKTKLKGNPYKNWIEMYSAEAYQDVAKAALLNLDELSASRMSEGRFGALVKTFCQATSLEIGFWDMGLNIQN